MSISQYHWSITATVDDGEHNRTVEQTVVTHSRQRVDAQRVFKEYLEEMGWTLVEYEDITRKN